ncbi:MAG: nickel pincer cofactor biosynthesis protein LarB [Veillonellaceae bacterium]|nr:nickel pincer cofactor biosynthesis protein LarB [Veillonellaceae bacterium]
MNKKIDDLTIDWERSKRQTFPEVVYCQGKTDQQCIEAFKALYKAYPTFLGTRGRSSIYEALKKDMPELVYDETSHILYVQKEKKIVNGDRLITVITAGTSDVPVAEEAAITAELMGNQVDRIYDVGVAGIHRLLDKLSRIRKANVIIVLAGMEGALASVVGGLVNVPVIAVPTSVGYGASFHGLAALLGMLNSCSAGVSVMNIDNGFGAGRLAHTINSRR